MNDTHPQIEMKIIEMIQRKTPAERLAMGCSMFDFSKQLVTDSIRKEKPNLLPALLQRELFLRFYGSEFDPARREKIAKYFSEKDFS